MNTYIDPHVHMVSRTTDCYEHMAMSGCVAVTEPAFWAGYDRGSADAFRTYFEQLTTHEPKRAAQYGIRHYTWICLNPKEGEDLALNEEVLRFIPEFLDHPHTLGVGEIGLNRVTRNEMTSFLSHVDLATQRNELILIHTPHLEDKYKGTVNIIDALTKDARIDPCRVLIDHVEEHTIGPVLDKGFWCGITLYPQTKTSADRAIDMVESYGVDRLCVNSACDWGPSVPLAVPQFIMAMRKRGHGAELIRRVGLENPSQVLEQSGKFSLA